MGGFHYTMIIRDDLTRYTWVYFLKQKSEAAETFEQFLSDVRDLGEVETVRSDDGGEFTSKAFVQVCSRHRIKRELTTADSAAYNGVAERALGHIVKTSLAASIQAPLLYPDVKVPTADDLWPEAVRWACDTLNRSATTANPQRTSPYEMMYDKTPAVRILPFLKPCFYRNSRRNRKHKPLGAPGFYLEPGINHPRDSMRILSLSRKVITTRNVTWWAPSPKPTANGFPEAEAGREAGNDTEATTDNPDDDSSSSDRDLGSSQTEPSDDDMSSSSESSSEASTEEKDDVVERAEADSHDSGAEETESTPQPLRTVLRQLSSFNSDPPNDSNKKLGRTRRQTSLLSGNVAEEAFCLMKEPPERLHSGGVQGDFGGIYGVPRGG